uniref:Uncharacterized protein n=1 Tax=Timema cristinae TaxID=61476 RepID=A0A7R9H204_TIMCR|nr:unnamed protein product [Timema cristinae]
MGGPRQEEVPWDLFDRCLLPVLFCHAAAVILATLLNLLYISSVSIFTVFLWLLVIVLGGVFFYHNLKVTAAGKGVFITECDSPLGYAAARQLDEMFLSGLGRVSQSSQGSRTRGKAQKLKGESSGRLHVLELDVTSEEQIVAAAKYIGLNLPLGATGLWGVINNASWAPFGEVEWVPFKVYKQATDVNLLSVIRITQIFLPLLRKTKGRFINVVSIQGRVASPFKSPYCIVKAGVEAFSECLRLEMRKWGVDVVLVEPGNYTSWSGCTDEELYGQARQMWNEMSEEAKADYEAPLGNQRLRVEALTGDTEVLFLSCVQRPRHPPSRHAAMLAERLVKGGDFSAILRTLSDAVSRTFPLPRYTPVTWPEKMQALVADHLPRAAQYGLTEEKRKSWERYVKEELRQDPWDIPFRIASGKIRPPAMMSTLKRDYISITICWEETAEFLMEKLLPDDEEKGETEEQK